jgi:hypothetical protein
MLLDEAFGLARDVISRIFPDKTDAQKAQAQLELLKTNGELQLMTERNKIAAAEAASSDKWTSRARPTFMYVFYILLMFLIIIGPIIGIFFNAEMKLFYANVQEGFSAIPDALWGTFIAGYLGYSGFRTFEKAKGVSK